VHDIGYYNLSNVAGWPATTGSIQLPMVNMRSNYTFEYLSGPSRTVAATSATVTFADDNEPTQLRLALCDVPGCMSVTWVRRGTASAVLVAVRCYDALLTDCVRLSLWV